MAVGTTFEFSEYMHINVGNKNLPSNCHFLMSLRVKGHMNESHQIFVQPKAFKPLMLET